MTEARRLTHDEIEERRKNLAFIRENAALLENGDYLFTTTLLMQEQWLATVDALVSREGELVAALEAAEEDLEHNCDECTRLREDNQDWAAWPVCNEGMRLGNRAYELRRAALQVCDTCKGTRVAPSDPDLGGGGVTMSSCPECVVE